MNELFYEVFENMPRQGPGTANSTKKAFMAIKSRLPEKPQLDALAWVRKQTDLPLIAAGRMGRPGRFQDQFFQCLLHVSWVTFLVVCIMAKSFN